jgi:hypothetical protein
VLIAFWSPKGGSGTSVVAAACATVLAHDGDGARLADFGGDQPAIFGLGSEPQTGISDWLVAGSAAPRDALERLTIGVVPGVVLVPRGSVDRPLAPRAAAVAGAAIAGLLREGSVPTVADVGVPATAATRAVVEVADRSVLVVRGCYLALRRAVQSPLLDRCAGVVLVEEPGRSLGVREVRDTLDRPVLARVPVRSAVARAVDAGVLGSRLPEVLGRPVRRLLMHLELFDQRARTGP